MLRFWSILELYALVGRCYLGAVEFPFWSSLFLHLSRRAVDRRLWVSWVGGPLYQIKTFNVGFPNCSCCKGSCGALLFRHHLYNVEQQVPLAWSGTWCAWPTRLFGRPSAFASNSHSSGANPGRLPLQTGGFSTSITIPGSVVFVECLWGIVGGRQLSMAFSSLRSPTQVSIIVLCF